MAITHEPERMDVAPDKELGHDVPRGRRGGFRMLAVLLAALVGFGLGWLVFDDSGVDVPSEVDAVLDDYRSAWNSADGELAVGFMTADGVHISSGYPGGVSGDRLIGVIDNVYLSGVRNIEYVSVSGDSPYLVVMSATAFGYDGYSVFHMVEEAGELKIARHTWYLD